MTGRPPGWKASDEAFALWLDELQRSRSRRDALRFERPHLPAWATAARGYATRTEQYRRLLRERPTYPNERTA